MPKIKPKKHRGVLDPIKQRNDRLLKIKDKINDPPKDGNDQAKISNSVKRFQKLKEMAISGKFKKLKHGVEDFPKKFDKNNKPKPMKTFANFKKHKHETEASFMSRVNRTTREGIQEAKYEMKYGVDVDRDVKTGAVTITKKKDNELDNNSKRKKLTQLEKDTIKEQVKKNIREHKESKIEPVEFQTDYVKFGETVHAPPNIKTLPRKATKTESTSRPGQKNLLLRSVIDPECVMMPNERKAPTINFNSAKITENGKIDKKGKRKDLPIGTRAMLEHEQQQVMEMYRLLKKAKTKPFPAT